MNDKDEPIDQLAVLRAQLDQMIAIMPEMARTAWAWFGVFQGEGFSDKQALYLTACQMIQNPGTAPS
jgi:hypothetical protein